MKGRSLRLECGNPRGRVLNGRMPQEAGGTQIAAPARLDYPRLMIAAAPMLVEICPPPGEVKHLRIKRTKSLPANLAAAILRWMP